LSLLDIFKKKSLLPPSVLPLEVDIHSHLIPGIDDGIQTIEEGLDILRAMVDLGYKKIITTPHTMMESYPNTPEIINNGLKSMRKAIEQSNIPIKMEAATEYYLDESFIERLDNDEPLMTFGDNYVLFETSCINEPPFLKEATFKMTVKGYKPVYAHPERYLYLIENDNLLEEMVDRDIFFQLNLNSLSGVYSKPVQKFAEKLIDRKIVSFVGTDCHHFGHMEYLEKSTQTKHFKKLLDLDLLNNTLL